MLVEYVMTFIIEGASDGRARKWTPPDSYPSASACMEARRPLLADLPENVKVECHKQVIYKETEHVDD